MQQQFYLNMNPSTKKWTLDGVIVGYTGTPPFPEAENQWTEEPMTPTIEGGYPAPCTGSLQLYNLYLSQGKTALEAAALSNYCA